MVYVFGFTVRRSREIPSAVRSLTDLRNRRIYIPQRDSISVRASRSVVLQTLGHFALDHPEPQNFADFLRQRVEANYFAGAALMPEISLAPFLQTAKANRNLAVEDIRDAFYVSYEMAAHRFTNLATRHLDLPIHFVRSDELGIIWEAYENNGVPFPRNSVGAIEGQRLCREWGTRQAFRSDDRYSIRHQYTDTPVGTFWCSTRVEIRDSPPMQSLSVWRSPTPSTFGVARRNIDRYPNVRTASAAESQATTSPLAGMDGHSPRFAPTATCWRLCPSRPSPALIPPRSTNSWIATATPPHRWAALNIISRTGS